MLRRIFNSDLNAVRAGLLATALAAILSVAPAHAQDVAPAAEPAAEAPAEAPAAEGTPPAEGETAAEGTDAAAAGEPPAPEMRPVLGPDGEPMLGPDGEPMMEPVPAPIPDRIPLIGPDGNPILNDKGQPLTAPILRDAAGNPVLDAEGKPQPAELALDRLGNILLGQDGQPMAEGTPEAERAKHAHDLTPLGFFMMADWVVKSVIIMLIIASVATWALLFGKLISFSSLNRRTDKFLEEFRRSQRLQDVAPKLGAAVSKTPMAHMMVAAVKEMDLTLAQGPASTGEKRDHLTARIAAAMEIEKNDAALELGVGMSTFATVGSISPFVGLFGTVWGIMNAFIGIANTNTTNLAVVAPGIAEALFVTAVGLFAAIPAVIFYNIFARKISAYNSRLDNFAAELLNRVSRQLDKEA